MTGLQQGIDQWGLPIVGSFPQSNTINAICFTAAGAGTDNVPTGAKFVLIGASQGIDVFVKIGGVAAVPSATVANGSASEANPLLRALNGAATVGVAVSSACIVTLAYYS